MGPPDEPPTRPRLENMMGTTVNTQRRRLAVALAAVGALAALTVAPSPAARADDPIKFFAPCGTVKGPHWSHAGKSGTKYHVFATGKASVIHAVCTFGKASVPLIARQTYTGDESKIKGHFGFNDCRALPLVGLRQKIFAGNCIDDQEGDSFTWFGVGLHYPGIG